MRQQHDGSDDEPAGGSADRPADGHPDDRPTEQSAQGPTDRPEEGSAPARRSPVMGRRGFIAGGAAAVAAAALAGGLVIGRETGARAPAGDAAQADEGSVQYHSTGLTAPQLTVQQGGADVTGGLLFLTPQDPQKNMQGVIADVHGEPVWLAAPTQEMTDLNVQQYRGKNVLTFWTGKSTNGHGSGVCIILDDHYKEVARVQAGNGLQADLHEFNLTDRGTALITAYAAAKTDLTSVGGPRDGWVYEGHAQEIDVATGKVLLDWASLDHVPVDETYQGLGDDSGMNGQSAGGAFDYFHINSIDDDGDTLLISARHTHTLYRVNRSTGAVLWRLGGRSSDFTVPTGAHFAWQHDARVRGTGLVSMMDNHLKFPADGSYSRGLVLQVDETKHAVTRAGAYEDRHLNTAMGNLQYLPSGNRLVGWGMAPYVTEFQGDGTPAYQLYTGGVSYRAFRAQWQATPAHPPQLAVQHGSGRLTVYVSWNGATEVDRWRILTGSDASHLSPAAVRRRSGFETTVAVPAAQVVRAEALDKTGTVIGRSAAVTA